MMLLGQLLTPWNSLVLTLGGTVQGSLVGTVSLFLWVVFRFLTTGFQGYKVKTTGRCLWLLKDYASRRQRQGTEAITGAGTSRELLEHRLVIVAV